MNNVLQTLSQNQLVILMLPYSREKDMLFLVSDLAVKGPVRIVDGGNHFNVLSLSRMIRRRTNDIKKILDQIYISRAFTCFQVETMLRNLSPHREPILVIDMLHTFYDESVNDQQSGHLLANCVRHLKWLSSLSPVLVSISPPPKTGKRPFLAKTLLKAANSTWHWEKRSPSHVQVALWE